MKFGATRTASSPFVSPRISSPFTDGRLSWLRKWVVKGSENDVEGDETNGGGNGREGRFEQREKPVSKQNGEFDRRPVTAPSGDGVVVP